MGNRISNLCLCSAGTRDISGRLQNTFTLLSKKHDKAICNSISYVRQNPPRISGDTFSDDDDAAFTTFRSVAGATVSANSSSTPSISLDDSLQHSTVLDSSASFESFGSFTSTMMHPQYQNQHDPRSSSVCITIEEGLASCPFDRVFNANSIEKYSEEVKMNKPNKISLKKVLSRVFSNAVSGTSCTVVVVRNPPTPSRRARFIVSGGAQLTTTIGPMLPPSVSIYWTDTKLKCYQQEINGSYKL